MGTTWSNCKHWSFRHALNSPPTRFRSLPLYFWTLLASTLDHILKVVILDAAFSNASLPL